MTKMSRQKFKYLENKKSFWSEIKNIFHHFKRVFSCQKLSQTLEWAFKSKLYTEQDKTLPKLVGHLLVQIQQWRHQENVWYLFKFNNKATRMQNDVSVFIVNCDKILHIALIFVYWLWTSNCCLLKSFANSVNIINYHLCSIINNDIQNPSFLVAKSESFNELFKSKLIHLCRWW